MWYGKVLYDLGCIEHADIGNMNRAVKHWIIAAGTGDKEGVRGGCRNVGEKPL